MYRIKKKFTFSASHVLTGLPGDHPCSRLHGHNYEVEVVLEGETLDPVGFIVDYRSLQPIKDYIDHKLDHRHLNDVMVENPTAETIARVLYFKFSPQFPALAEVRVSETPKTWASYRPY